MYAQTHAVCPVLACIVLLPLQCGMFSSSCSKIMG